MGRPRTGTVEYVRPRTIGCVGHYRIRATTPDGGRVAFSLDPEHESPEAEQRVRQYARRITEQLERAQLGGRAKARRPIEDTDSDARWWEQFFTLRDELNMYSVRGTYKTHIAPRLTLLEKTIYTLRPQDCEAIRNALDDLIRAGRMDGGTATRAWQLLAVACKAAAGRWRHDRRRNLQVRPNNPCADLFPPIRTERKELQWLYPGEFLRLVSCELVPLEARRRYALAVYLFCRAGELAALDWSRGDIDLEHGTVSIRRSWNRVLGVEKSTKTGDKGVRRFGVDRVIVPLLRAMHEECGGKGRVIDRQELNRWAEHLRDHLKLAGISRPELFNTDQSRKQLRFHDLRATGITWLAIRGDQMLAIRSRAGHQNWKTTERYLRNAEMLGNHDIGQVFPSLPSALLGEGARTSTSPIVLAPVSVPRSACCVSFESSGNLERCG